MVDYEETMRLIKEATGVSDINEVIAKFQSQGDTHSHLTQLQKSNEARIEDLKAKKAKVFAEFEELKFTGEAKHSHSLRMLEEFETHLKDSQMRADEAKQKFEKASKILANAKSGIQHLADKLESVRLVNNTCTINVFF